MSSFKIPPGKVSAGCQAQLDVGDTTAFNLTRDYNDLRIPCVGVTSKCNSVSGHELDAQG